MRVGRQWPLSHLQGPGDGNGTSRVGGFKMSRVGGFEMRRVRMAVGCMKEGMGEGRRAIHQEMK